MAATTTASSTTTTSTSTTTTQVAVDSCFVGTWRALAGELPQTYNGVSVNVSGGSGTILVFKANGAYSANFAKTRPYTARTSDGHHLAVAVSGAAVGTFTASGGQFTLADSQTTLTVTVTVDGKVTSTASPSAVSSAQYVCVPGKQLTLSSGGFPTRYVPVS